ncbi:MAG: glycerophosphodiester phosphodiesterase, partial [Flavobacteriales bacterium]|nr:glycerophosphodiester phosphodiesterase [Flavobacteriales bacterium]
METWAHRGEHHDFQENSPQAILQASVSGFSGVEIDVFFDNELGLVVSHDEPYELLDGNVLLLEDVILELPPEFRFWIDLKNLSSSNLKRVRKAFNKVFELEAGLLERTFIESGNGPALRRLNDDFNCIYWVQYNNHGLRGKGKLWSIKFLLSITNFDGITTDHRYIDEGFQKHFKGKCWY